ncbi:MAG: ribosomal protein [Chloroflexi bacterium]|nr:ribosomal protein [Chloroflexota bacterium]
MKTGIHPEYVEATVHCACGNAFTTRSTKASIRTDLCSKCHPFFTGDQRLIDTGGQVERFMRRLSRGKPGAPGAEGAAEAAAETAKASS